VDHTPAPAKISKYGEAELAENVSEGVKLAVDAKLNLVVGIDFIRSFPVPTQDAPMSW
jgi:hypothetical protein